MGLWRFQVIRYERTDFDGGNMCAICVFLVCLLISHGMHSQKRKPRFGNCNIGKMGFLRWVWGYDSGQVDPAPVE